MNLIPLAVVTESDSRFGATFAMPALLVGLRGTAQTPRVLGSVRPLRALAGIVLLLTLATHRLCAQTPSPSAIPAPATVFASDRVPELTGTQALDAPNSSLRRAPDHRYEGAVLGAVVLGAGFALLASAGDSDSGSDPSPVLLGLGGAALGGLLGLLIGGAVPKGQ